MTVFREAILDRIATKSAASEAGEDRVLGLTMAEIMLLLVFCLLIAVGVALATERARHDEVSRQLRDAQATVDADASVVGSIRRNARLTELFDRAAAAGAPAAIDEFWRKLVESEAIVDGAMLHLIKMWLEAPVEETDEKGNKHRSTR